MNKKYLFFVLSAVVLIGMTGCSSPEFASSSPENNATGVSVFAGQGLDFSTNTISVTYDVAVQLEYSSQATIDPAPIAVSSAAAHGGTLKIAVPSYDSETVYLYYSTDYKLTSGMEHTVIIESIWNRNDFMGASNRSDTDQFTFTTE